MYQARMQNVGDFASLTGCRSTEVDTLYRDQKDPDFWDYRVTYSAFPTANARVSCTSSDTVYAWDGRSQTSAAAFGCDYLRHDVMAF